MRRAWRATVTTSARDRLRDDHGAVSVIAAIMLAFCGICAVGLGDLSAVLSERGHVSAAADAAALAGAEGMSRGVDPESAAREVAAANGVSLRSATIDEAEGTVIAEVSTGIETRLAGSRTLHSHALAVAPLGGIPRPGDPMRLLGHAGLSASTAMRIDIALGRIDVRTIGVIEWMLARGHTVALSSLVRHSLVGENGRKSNHWFGRAVDISMIDGKPVRDDHDLARALVLQLDKIPAGNMRPTEIGSPWTEFELFGVASKPVFFNDSDHEDHLHIGYHR